MVFKCIKTCAIDASVYGVDFVVGKRYYGEVEDYEGFYIHSTENGTDVYLSNEEVREYFEMI